MTWVRLIGCSLVFIFRCGLWFLMRQGKHLGILSSIFCQSILEACISQALRGIHGKTPYPLLVQRHRHFRASPQIHLLGIYMFSFSVWFVVCLAVFPALHGQGLLGHTRRLTPFRMQIRKCIRACWLDMNRRPFGASKDCLQWCIPRHIRRDLLSQI